MGYMQGSLAFGMLLGPVVSAPLYAILKYAYTFVFYGSAILIFGVGGACALPSRLNKSSADPSLETVEITFCMFFKNTRCAMSLITLVYA